MSRCQSTCPVTSKLTREDESYQRFYSNQTENVSQTFDELEWINLKCEQISEATKTPQQKKPPIGQ